MSIPTYDRDRYRDMTDATLVRLAREEGLNPELAIAITERFAAAVKFGFYGPSTRNSGTFQGNFHFNQGSIVA